MLVRQVELMTEKYQRPQGPCNKCGAFKGVRFLEHHITYASPSQKAVLCESCHKRITGLNTKVARLRGYVALTNFDRYFIFEWWMDEKVVLRRITDKIAKHLIEKALSASVLESKS